MKMKMPPCPQGAQISALSTEQGPNGSALKIRDCHSMKSQQGAALPLSVPSLPLPPRGAHSNRALPQRCGPHHHWDSGCFSRSGFACVEPKAPPQPSGARGHRAGERLGCPRPAAKEDFAAPGQGKGGEVVTSDMRGSAHSGGQLGSRDFNNYIVIQHL